MPTHQNNPRKVATEPEDEYSSNRSTTSSDGSIDHAQIAQDKLDDIQHELSELGRKADRIGIDEQDRLFAANKKAEEKRELKKKRPENADGHAAIKHATAKQHAEDAKVAADTKRLKKTRQSLDASTIPTPSSTAMSKSPRTAKRKSDVQPGPTGKRLKTPTGSALTILRLLDKSSKTLDGYKEWADSPRHPNSEHARRIVHELERLNVNEKSASANKNKSSTSKSKKTVARKLAYVSDDSDSEPFESPTTQRKAARKRQETPGKSMCNVIVLSSDSDSEDDETQVGDDDTYSEHSSDFDRADRNEPFHNRTPRIDDANIILGTLNDEGFAPHVRTMQRQI